MRAENTISEIGCADLCEPNHISESLLAEKTKKFRATNDLRPTVALLLLLIEERTRE